jgi:hypothetical protein
MKAEKEQLNWALSDIVVVIMAWLIAIALVCEVVAKFIIIYKH